MYHDIHVPVYRCSCGWSLIGSTAPRAHGMYQPFTALLSSYISLTFMSVFSRSYLVCSLRAGVPSSLCPLFQQVSWHVTGVDARGSVYGSRVLFSTPPVPSLGTSPSYYEEKRSASRRESFVRGSLRGRGVDDKGYM